MTEKSHFCLLSKYKPLLTPPSAPFPFVLSIPILHCGLLIFRFDIVGSQ